MRNGYLRSFCPFCWNDDGRRPSKRNFSINAETRWYSCWRCERKGKYGDAYAIPDAELLPQETDHYGHELPAEFVRFSDMQNGFGSNLAAYNYLVRKRGVSEETIKLCQIGACASGHLRGSVVIPLFEFGECRGYVAKNIVTGAYRYPAGLNRGQLFFNSDALWRRTADPIILVEGCFDALPYYPDGVAVLGKPAGGHKDILSRVKRPIAVCLDADAQGTGWALASRLQLSGVRAAYVQLPAGYDPAEVDSGELRQKARSYFPDSAVL